MTDRLVVAAFSEIVLKSPTVRRHMEAQLKHQIKTSLKRKNIEDCKITKGGGRIYVQSSKPEIALQSLVKISGIDFASIALRTEPEVISICNSTIEYLTPSLSDGESFAVRARVVDNKTITAKEIEIQAGQAVLDRLTKKNPRVDLDHPHKTVHIEVRGSDAFIYCDQTTGPGGLPVGTQGKMLGIFLDGSLSIVASWMMLRRGALIVPIYVEPWTGDSDISIEEIVESLTNFREWVPIPRLSAFVIRSKEIMRRVTEIATEDTAELVYRGAILRASDIIARREGALGIVLGNRMITSEPILSGCKSPIYQPLIGLTAEQLTKYLLVLGISPEEIREPQYCATIATQKCPDLAKLLNDENLQNEIAMLVENPKRITI